MNMIYKNKVWTINGCHKDDGEIIVELQNEDQLDYITVEEDMSIENDNLSKTNKTTIKKFIYDFYKMQQ